MLVVIFSSALYDARHRLMDDMVTYLLFILLGLVAYMGFKFSESSDESLKAQGKKINNHLARVLVLLFIGTPILGLLLMLYAIIK